MTPLRLHSTRPLTGRLAPSPTGALHLGHARTFLLTWWHLRQRGASVHLRHEDLDAGRARPEHQQAIEDDLRWLGVDWDGPPVVQSRGLDRLQAALAALHARGLAYWCTCSRAELRQLQSAPQLGELELRYPGTCRGRWSTLEEAEREAGREAGLRFRVPSGEIRFVDQVLGPQRFDVQATVGDFLISRRDKTPAYQLAVVLDDADAGITEVHRGADLLASTARQLLLQRALGLPTPRYHHFPLVLDAEGRRLAKRVDSLSLATLRAGGAPAERVVAWVARSAGLSVPRAVSARELIHEFTLERVPTQPVRWLGTLD